MQHTPPSDVPAPLPQDHLPPTSPKPIPGAQNVTRLTKLSIPMFSGNTLQWQPFWNCFEAAIHYNPTITGVQN